MKAIVRLAAPRGGSTLRCGGSIELLGGAVQGRDTLNQLVSSWAGWKRLPTAVRLPGGGACSVYRAALWPATVLPLVNQTRIQLELQEGVRAAIELCLSALRSAETELSPPPSHQAPLEWPDEWLRAPMPHQVKAIRAICAMAFRAILADDMGLGKTASSIYCWQQSAAPRALIVCPKTVKRNWIREIESTLRGVQLHLIDGTPGQRATAIGHLEHELRNPSGDRAAAVINYDLLHRLEDRQIITVVEWIQDQFLILDESHYAKNRKAERTKFVLEKLAPPEGGARGRLCLSGTPIRNTTEDLWSQVQIVRPGTWASFAQFDKMHLIRSEMQIDTGKRTRGGKPVTKVLHPVRRSNNREQLNAIINTLQVRRRKEEVLNLPSKIFTYPEFELDPPTARIYRLMKEQALIELAELGDDTPIFAPQANSALEVTLRCEQIAQGFLGGIPERYLDLVTPHLKSAEKIETHPGAVMFPRSVKIEWLKETIETVIGQGGRPVVFSRFNVPLFWLVKQWEGAAMLHGGLSMKERDQIIDTFQRNGHPVLFCQVKIAEGFNLTASQDVIFYGRDWSPAINAQATDRCHRIGQRGTVNVQIPIVEGTFESYLHKKLAAKEADAQQALKSMTVGELREAL